MAKTKQQEEIIEKICYQSNSQSISYREIYQLNEKKLKLEIKSDSYHNQCYARAYVLKDDDWNVIYTIPYSLMQTPEGLAYKSDYKNKPAVAEGNFKEDIQKLKNYIGKILF